MDINTNNDKDDDGNNEMYIDNQKNKIIKKSQKKEKC